MNECSPMTTTLAWKVVRKVVKTSAQLYLVALLALLIFLLVGSPMLAQELDFFDPAAAWVDPISQNSLSVVWGDLDSDGDLDMVVGTLKQGIRIFTNENGILVTPLVLREFSDAGSLSLGDLDGDGDLDMVVGNGYTLFGQRDQPNSFYLNQTAPDGLIEFVSAQVDWRAPPSSVLDIGSATADIALADINSDGMLDLAVADDELVRVYHNLTDPTLALSADDDSLLTFDSLESSCPGNAPPANRSGGALQLSFGDVNNDMLPDLAVGFADGTAQVWVNDGDGCFEPTTIPLALPGAPTDMEWGDLNNDGFADLAVSTSGASNVVFSNRMGQLAETYWSDGLEEISEGITWGDADGDGDLDLAVANREPHQSHVYLNGGYAEDGSPGFTLAWSDPIPRVTLDVRWADLDGDRDLDLATAVYAAPDLVIENLSASLTSRPVIIPANDAVGAASYLSAQSLAWGDMDNDGDLDLAVGYSGPQNRILLQNLTDDEWYQRIAPNAVYENRGGVLISDTLWLSDDAAPTISVAWGDFDADGDLDLAAGNHGGEIVIYRNLPAADGYALETTASCTIDVAYDGLLAKLLQDIDLTRQLRSDPALLANVREDDDLLATLVEDEGVFAAIDNDAALLEQLRGDDELMALLLADSGLLADLFTIGFETDASPVSAPDGSVIGDKQILDDLMDEVKENHPKLFTQILDVVAMIESGDREALDVWLTEGSDEEREVALTAVIAMLDIDSIFQTSIWSADDLTDMHLLAYLLSDDDLLGESLRDVFKLAPAGAVSSIAWGDVNSDGFLDLAVGMHDGINRVYLYDRESDCFTVGDWLPSVEPQSTDPTTLPLQRVQSGNTYTLAWGDVDNDGDLDLAVGNHTGDVSGSGNRDFVYLNRDGMLADEPAYVVGDEPTSTRGLAWGDMDGDGDLDLATVTWSGQKRVFENVAGVLLPEPRWISADTDLSTSAAWGDADGDGDLDLAVGNVTLFGAGATNDIYYNRNGILDKSPGWQSTSAHRTHSVAWGDLNGDGLLDLAAGNQQDSVEIYSGKEPRPRFGSSVAPTLSIGLHAEPTITASGAQSMLLAPADFQAVPNARASDVISIPYRLTDPAQRPIQRVSAYYSLNGIDWRPAIPSPSTVTENLITALPTDLEAEPHIFGWNLQDRNAENWLFGQVSNVLFRMEAHPMLQLVVDDIAGSYQRGAIATQTYPFQARGIQIQIFQEDGSAAEGAIVYRLPKLQKEGATRLESTNGDVYRSGPDGILIGQGELNKNDQLIAMLPISATHAYELYLTSGAPNETSVDMQRVSAPGLIPITVTKDNPLYLFNLDVSLEWDASADTEFLSRLETAFKNASAILFDVTDGQVALGEIRIHNAKEAWTWADIVIYASNSVRPRATMGGVVYEPTVDSDMIPKAGRDDLPPMYVPGQIHMGTFWDPFGQSQLELQQDWQRALAHELGHYLLFLPDNYLGIRDGLLTTVDCQGSIMTNAYDEDSYGELLTASQWDDVDKNPDCQLTVAETMLTGRSDWETVQKFLPALQAPSTESANPGPAILPLDITRVLLPPVGSSSAARYLPPRNFDLRDEQGNLTPVREGEAYLYKMGPRRGREPRPVTEIIPLGSTGSGRDRLKVRGAGPGDRLCVFDNNSRPPRVACVEALTRSVQSLSLKPVEGWAPDITVTPVTSRTMAISVTQVVTGSNLMIQVVPAYGPPTMPHIINAPVAVTMDPVRSSGIVTGSQLVESTEVITQWSKVITVAHPSFEGFVRAYEEMPAGSAPHETVTQYFLSAGWNPNSRLGTGGGVNTYPWGPNSRLGTGGGTNSRLGTGGGTNSRLGTGGGTNSRLGTGGGTNSRLGTGGGTNSRLGTGGGANVRAWGAHQRTLEAPIASGDGRVTLFNLDDILADVGAASLQAMSAPPTLDPWLTAVGRTYRLNLEQPDDANKPIEYTLAFQYLEREVPPGYESVLRIYHLPEEGDQWQALDTRVDSGANLAAALIPQSPNGVYALIATVELPPMAPGWNMLAYTIPQTRTVASALESIVGHYTTVRHYDPVSEPSWRVFDPSYGQKAAGLPYAANSLDVLEFGNSYLIYIVGTDVITPYLRIPDVVNDAQRGKPGQSSSSGELVNVLGNNTSGEGFGIFNDDSGQLTVAPAHFFGEVILPIQIEPDAEAKVRAKVGDQVCGETTVTKLDNGICVYMLDVVSDGAANGCGAVGQQVTFELQTDGQSWSVGDSPWENRSVQRLDLLYSEP